MPSAAATESRSWRSRGRRVMTFLIRQDAHANSEGQTQDSQANNIRAARQFRFSRISILSLPRSTSRARFRPTDFVAPGRLTPTHGPSVAPQAHERPARSKSSRISPTYPGLSGHAHAFSAPRFTPAAPDALRSGRSSGAVSRRALPNRSPAFAAPRSCASG